VGACVGEVKKQARQLKGRIYHFGEGYLILN